MIQSDSRYLTDAALDEFMAVWPKTAFRIPGTPKRNWCSFLGLKAGLRCGSPGRCRRPDLSEYEHLSASVVRAGEQAWAELLIDDPDVFRRAIAALADRSTGSS